MQILITGAAGLIGGELAAKLIEDNHAIVGMVRFNNKIRSNEGGLLPAEDFKHNMPAPGQLFTIHGDISERNCGLDRSFKETLSQNIDLVIHCAAVTAFDAAAGVYEAINIKGTENIRNLCPGARFLHVSTAYTCGALNGVVPEVLHGPETMFMNGYEESKSRAEVHIMRSGPNVVIARPSIVVGEHQTGQIKAFDTIYAMFRLMVEGLISSIPTSPNATLDFVPIDHVIHGLLDIIKHWDVAEGKIFHLSSGNAIKPQMLVDAIGSFAQLQKPELVAVDDFSPEDLPPRQRRLFKRTASHYATYFDRNPQFVTENLRNLSGRTCQPVDTATITRMINYCIESGFLDNR